MLNDRDTDPQVVQSDRLVSKYVMGAWLQFVYVSERAFPSNILLLEYSFRLEFFILHSTNMEADDVQMERKGKEWN